MTTKRVFVFVFMAVLGISLTAKEGWAMDLIKTSDGDLQVTIIGHGSLMLAHGGKVIHVDPWGQQADYSTLPKADLILVTHDHRDHLDLAAIKAITKETTQIVVNMPSKDKVEGAIGMANGDVRTVAGINIEAVPAYNIVHMRSPGQPFHPKGVGNGYVLTFGDKRIYVAGDTENTEEMKALKDIHCAFLPMNLPYTMTPEMVADAAKAMRLDILYPYHRGETDTGILKRLLKETGVEVRVR